MFKGLGVLGKGSTSLLKSSFSGFTKFSKNTKGLYKGVNHAAIRGKAYKAMIKRHNIKAGNAKLGSEFSNFDKQLGRINSLINNLLKDN